MRKRCSALRRATLVRAVESSEGALPEPRPARRFSPERRPSDWAVSVLDIGQEPIAGQAAQTGGGGGGPAARADEYSVDVVKQAHDTGADPAARADGASADPPAEAECAYPRFEISRLPGVQAGSVKLVGPSGRSCPALWRPNQARLMNLDRGCASGQVTDGRRAPVESVLRKCEAKWESATTSASLAQSARNLERASGRCACGR